MSQALPRWRCHKTVHAVKLRAVDVITEEASDVITEANDAPTTTRIRLTPANSEHAAFDVPVEWWTRSYNGNTLDCGYYVLFEDGYESWSPSKAFEEGYTRL